MEPSDRHYESIWQHMSTIAFRQGWIEAGNVRTRYVQAGPEDAPAVIMLHGTGGTWEAYMANLGAHSQHFNCYAFDFMGSGYSQKPLFDYEIAHYMEQIRDFMTAMKLKKASIIGISLGAWVATRFASTYPELTEKVTLNAPFGLSEDETEISAIVARRVTAYGAPKWENIKKIFDNLMFRPEKRIDDLIALRRSTYATPDAQAAAPHVLAVMAEPYLRKNLITPEECERIRAKFLIVISLADKPLYVNTARRLLELIPEARGIEIDNVAHWPQFEDPETFNRENIRFLLEG